MGLDPRKVITYFTSSVWLVNGLVCKIMGLVPRHEEIVSRILGANIAHQLTVFIGFLELGMGLWVLSGQAVRVCTILQIVAVISMNVIEYRLASDLLLWGRLNLFFAFLFILLVFVNEFRSLTITKLS